MPIHPGDVPPLVLRSIVRPAGLTVLLVIYDRSMKIEIQNPALEARLEAQMQAFGTPSAEDAILHLLEAKEENDRWLLENRDLINEKIRRGLDQLDRGEGIAASDLPAYLAKLKAQAVG
ncbi:MAG: hypothetical protein IT162_13300 [Bryobacterales bacterium]|nr:hypothetical protein [Bryobacterales bacterium]